MDTSKIQIKPFLIATILTLLIMVSVVIGLLKVISKDINKVSEKEKTEIFKGKKNKIVKENLNKKELSKTKTKTKKSKVKYYSLYTEVTPKKAKIRILNIKPKYKNGIKLKKGKYHVEVSKKGYSTVNKWIEIKDKNIKFKVKLKKKKQVNVNSLFNKV